MLNDANEGKGDLILTSIHCCNAPRNSRKQHGLSVISRGDHSSMTIIPILSAAIEMVSSTAKDLQLGICDDSE